MTTAQQEITARQEAAMNALYDTNTGTPEREAAIAVYDATVAELVALLGPEAACWDVDQDRWSMYSDCFKDDCGFRPTIELTVAEVNQYFAKRREELEDAH